MKTQIEIKIEVDFLLERSNYLASYIKEMKDLQFNEAAIKGLDELNEKLAKIEALQWALGYIQ